MQCPMKQKCLIGLISVYSTFVVGQPRDNIHLEHTSAALSLVRILKYFPAVGSLLNNPTFLCPPSTFPSPPPSN